jgi:ABC-type phosphate transport system substrate-binding protein
MLEGIYDISNIRGLAMKTLTKIFAVFVAVLMLFAVPVVAEDEFVIIANKDVAGSAISTAALKGIYLREVKNWGGSGTAIVPVDLTTASNFYQNLFGKSYVQMQAYWINMRVKYSVDLPVSKKDSASVKQFVAETKGAIGFLKSGDADDSVKILTLNK